MAPKRAGRKVAPCGWEGGVGLSLQRGSCIHCLEREIHGELFFTVSSALPDTLVLVYSCVYLGCSTRFHCSFFLCTSFQLPEGQCQLPACLPRVWSLFPVSRENNTALGGSWQPSPTWLPLIGLSKGFGHKNRLHLVWRQGSQGFMSVAEGARHCPRVMVGESGLKTR